MRCRSLISMSSTARWMVATVGRDVECASDLRDLPTACRDQAPSTPPPTCG